MHDLFPACAILRGIFIPGALRASFWWRVHVARARSWKLFLASINLLTGSRGVTSAANVSSYARYCVYKSFFAETFR